MKGKSYSIPYGMIFKKYYCQCCGNKLKKNKTHRVVNKEDKDYYQYQSYNMFPRIEHDVYDYEFVCPTCKKSISFKEQCVVERIQKKYKVKVLTDSQIKEMMI